MSSWSRLIAVWHSFNFKQKLGTVILLALLLLLPLQVLGLAPNIPYVSSYSEGAVVVPEGVALDSAVIITYVDGFSEYVKQDSSSKLDLFGSPDHRRVAISRVDCSFTVSVKSYTPADVVVTLTSNRTIIPYRNVEVELKTKSFSLTEDKNTEFFTVGMAHVSSNDLFPVGNLTGDGARADVYWTLTVDILLGSESFGEVGHGRFTGYWRDSSYSDSASTDVSTKSNMIQIPKQLLLEVWPNVGFTDSRTNFYLAYATYPEVSDNIDLPVQVVGCGYNFTVNSENFADGLAMVTLKPQITGNLSFIYPSWGKYVSFSPTMVAVYDSQTNSFAVSPSTIYAKQVSNLSVFVNPNLVNQSGYLKISGGGVVDFAEGSIEENMTFQILPEREGIITVTYQAVGYNDEVFQVQVLPESVQPIIVATPSRMTALHTGQWGGFTTIIHFSPAQYPYQMTVSAGTFDLPPDFPFKTTGGLAAGARVSSMGRTGQHGAQGLNILRGWSPAYGTGDKRGPSSPWYPVSPYYQFDQATGELLAIWCGYTYLTRWCWVNTRSPGTSLGWWDLTRPEQFRRAMGISEDPSMWTVEAQNSLSASELNWAGIYAGDMYGTRLFNEDGSWGDARWYYKHPDYMSYQPVWFNIQEFYEGYESINTGWYSSPALLSPYQGLSLPSMGVLRVSAGYPNSSIPILLITNDVFDQLWNDNPDFARSQDDFYVHVVMKNGMLQHSVALKIDPVLPSLNCRTGTTSVAGGQPDPNDPWYAQHPELVDPRAVTGPQGGYVANTGGGGTGNSGQAWLNLLPIVRLSNGVLAVGWLYIIFLVVATVLITDFDFRRIRFR